MSLSIDIIPLRGIGAKRSYGQLSPFVLSRFRAFALSCFRAFVLSCFRAFVLSRFRASEQ
jgi:hypothetical protein